MVLPPPTPTVACGGKDFDEEDAVSSDSDALGAVVGDLLEEHGDFEDAEALATFQVFASSYEDASFDFPTDPESLEAAEQIRLGRGLAEVQKAMRSEQLSFREARVAMVVRAMEEIGADATGMPTDPKAFTLESCPPRKPRRPLNPGATGETTILAGYLQKRSRLLRVWRPRWAVITSRHLCTYKSQEDALKPCLATEVLNLREITEVRRRGEDWVVVRVRPSMHSGCISGGVGLSTDSQARAILGQAQANRRSFVLRFESPLQAERWHEQLNKWCLKAKRSTRRPDLRELKVPQL